MTYEEIEALLKKHNYNGTIEQLRIAIGDEATALSEHAEGYCKDIEFCNKNAREYYANDISSFLNGDIELDPQTLIGHRERYAKSWAFARIVYKLMLGIGDSTQGAAVDDMVSKLCLANTELSLRLADLVHAEADAKTSDIHMQTIESVMESMDAVDAPKMTALGNRELNVLERIEVVLEDWKNLQERSVKQFNIVEECKSCRCAEKDLQQAMDDRMFLGRLVADLAMTIHAGHKKTEAFWEKCDQEHCVLVRTQLEKVGLNPDISETGRKS